MADQGQKRATLTVAVLTLNEAKRIKACLQSAAFADQLLVVDSGSSDDTVAIAQSMGAEVHIYPDWQGFAVQRNRLLQHATGDYIFFLDADEELNDDLEKEIKRILENRTQAVGKIKWRMVAFGRELKCLRSISRVERFFVRNSIVEFTGVVHEEAKLNKSMHRFEFKNHVLHFSRDSVADSLQKLNQYAVLGAAKRITKQGKVGIFRGVFSASNMFFRSYFLNRGFLCGGAGFLYSLFIALEAFFRYAILAYDKEIDSKTKRGG